MTTGSAIGSAIGYAVGAAAGTPGGNVVPSSAVRDRANAPILDRAGAYIEQRA